MKASLRLLLPPLMLLAAIRPAAATDEEERLAKQAKLDAACEVARQEKLAPLKARFVEECVAKQQRPDREACERFYSDYGNRMGNRPPLFYDLPECVTAEEFRRAPR